MNQLKKQLKIKEKKYLLIIALFVLVILVVFHLIYVAPLSSEVKNLKNEIERKNLLVEKYKTKIKLYQKKLPKLKRELAALKKEEIWLKPQESYKLAASLEQLLKSLVEQGKLEIINYQILPEKKRESFKEIKIRFEIRTHIQGLTEILSKIEKVKGIYVSELSITKFGYRQKFDLRVRLVCTKLYYG
ncbi:MAG TPA: hypothetical protein ENG63_08050 [Candidatus Desulfofervidus auxilii]|uniref:Type 4a pilus biogenesis protein PilO n=1 Tax=Desulfofervidus auxilii TaxID=1621989 RepID=A0A7C0YAS9_DESA2|nr:hypothetical protein [Candidatus Desulfofervidus auxilii]